MLHRRHIIQDWTRVEDFEVGSSEYRTFEYHVVADEHTERMTLTIKCLDADATTVRRLDPNELSPDVGEDRYGDIAGERMKQLFLNGMI